MHTIKDRAKYQYSWLSIKGADLGDNGPKTFQAKLKGYGMGSVNLKVCADALDGHGDREYHRKLCGVR